VRPFATTLTLFCLIVPVRAQAPAPLVIDGNTVTVVQSFPLTVTAPKGSDAYFWSYPSSVTASEVDNVLTVKAAPVGKLTIRVKMLVVDWKAQKLTWTQGATTFQVGTAPNPGPGPGPAPVPGAGLHVLIVYDSAKQSSMPAAQLSIISSTAPGSVRDYMTKKCAQVAGKADWAIWPDGGDASSYPSAPLKAMYGRPRQQLPWLVISKDGSSGYEGPLPADPAATLAILQKYGG